MVRRLTSRLNQYARREKKLKNGGARVHGGSRFRSLGGALPGFENTHRHGEATARATESLDRVDLAFKVQGDLDREFLYTTAFASGAP